MSQSTPQIAGFTPALCCCVKVPLPFKMKQKVLFVHSGGTQGPHEGSSDLVTYLRQMLGGGYEVLYPKMPDPDHPEYVLWKEHLEKRIAWLDDEVILVGHSLGGSVLLKYLSEENFHKSIAGLFLVAAPYWGKRDWEVDEYVLQKDFYAKLPHIRRIFLYHSRNDEVVPFNHLASYADKLPNAVVREFDSRRHLFSTGLPELVDDIKDLTMERYNQRMM
jgi:predicted alpha/beta hydrolase family esterase